MTATVLRLLQPLSRWLGWRRVVLVVQRDDEVLVSTLPRDLPVAVRLNTDETVSVTIGHSDEGDALLTDLRALMGTGYQAPGDRVALPAGEAGVQEGECATPATLQQRRPRFPVVPRRTSSRPHPLHSP
jgi:hypothetical protein